MGRRFTAASGYAGRRESLRPASSFDHVAHGTPTALREYIAECITRTASQAELVQTCAEIGDDRGLKHALRRFAAYQPVDEVGAV